MKFSDVGKPAPRPIPDEPTPPADLTEFMRWGLELQRGLAASVGGVLLRGARPVPVGASPGGTSRPATSGANALVGYGLRNPSGAAITVTLYDGMDAATGTYLFDVQLAAGESARDWFGNAGISLFQGLFVSDPAAVVLGSVFLRGSDY